MHKIVCKITSLFLIVLIMFSTMSFTVESHYCGDYLVDISMFSSVEKCDVDMPNDDCTTFKQDADCRFEKAGHCKNIKNIHEGSDLNNSDLSVKITKQTVFIAAFFKAFVFIDTKVLDTFITSKKYKPIALVNRVVLFENFRI